MLTKELTEELGSCIFKQFPDEGVYRISRVEEWLATNGYTLETLGVSDYLELIEAAPDLFGTPRYNEDSYVIVKRWHGSGESGHPADSFFGNKNIILNDDIIEMSQQSLYALTKVLGTGLTVQEMKQEIYESFSRAKDEGKLDFMYDRYVFPIGYCTDGYLVNGIITKNISPRGKSLYFSFEKTQIYSSTVQAHRRPSVQPTPVSEEDKEEVYKLLTANFPYDIPQHMAAVSKLLSDNHIDRSRYGFFKMKDLLAQMDYLELSDVVLGGVPQVMVTIRRSDKYQAAPAGPSVSAFRTEAPRSVNAADVGKTGEVEIPEGNLEDICNLPSKPLMILAQYLERINVFRDISELRGDISEDFQKAKETGKIRFYDGKIIFPCRWQRTDGNYVELTLKPSAYEGRAWFLSFVDTISRDSVPRTVQPGRQLENFAYLGAWNSFLSELADKAVALFGLKADELDKSAGKRLHAERRRHAQDARNFLRGGIFGVDDHIKPDLAAQDRCIAEILGVAYAGDRVLRAELFRHQAADEVDLVVFRNGDEKVRLAHARLQKDAGARAVALHTHDVEHGVNVVEHGVVAVDDDQIVVFARHLLGDGVADLTDTDNDDFHFCVSPKFSSASAVCCLRSTIKTLLNSAPMISMTEARYSHKSNTITAPSVP